MTEHPLPIAPLGFVPQSIVWIRLVLLGVLLTTALPFIGVLALMMPQKPTRTRQWVFGWLYKAAGIRLRIQGNPSQNPTLFVSNHTSYLDIILLGHLLKGRFVSKQEVKHWPIIGWVAACTGTLFISRKPQKALEERGLLRGVFASGESLILFPEATSTAGTSVLPFKSAFFDILFGEGAPSSGVQPVTLVYGTLNGIPMGRFLRHLYGWPAKVPLKSHLLQILRLGSVTVDVIFHNPLSPENFSSRKDLAMKAHATVLEGFSQTPEIPEP